VSAFVGTNLFALNECDSNSVRLTATELLMADCVANPTDEQVRERASGLLRQLVVEQARHVARSALHTASAEVRRYAKELREQADKDLERHGVTIRARIVDAIEAV
jgi:hypothetical protein